MACIATDVRRTAGGALGFSAVRSATPCGAVITACSRSCSSPPAYRPIERIVVAFIGISPSATSSNWLSWIPIGPRPLGEPSSPPRQRQPQLAIGMLGAVVMPHNIYLHSNVVLNRPQPHDDEGRRRLVRFEFGDTSLAMGLGWMINSAMVIVAAAVFFEHGISIDSLPQASATLEPLAGPWPGCSSVSACCLPVSAPASRRPWRR